MRSNSNRVTQSPEELQHVRNHISELVSGVSREAPFPLFHRHGLVVIGTQSVCLVPSSSGGVCRGAGLRKLIHAWLSLNETLGL